jgi:hypothetical protein
MSSFYLGVHRPHWLETAGVPLFVSRRVLHARKTLPTARAEWVLDSGGFTEIGMNGGWSLTIDDYAAEVERFGGIGKLAWAAPMDWMCEPSMLAKTGLTVAEHQQRTVANFLALRQRLGSLVAPVLQGWERDEYHRCVDLYERAGVDLAAESVVGVGSVCRREATRAVVSVLRSLYDTHGLRMHGFGIKGAALLACSRFLTSADSMAWSFTARNCPPLHGCSHKSCNNCLRFALRWRERLLGAMDRHLAQGTLEGIA